MSQLKAHNIDAIEIYNCLYKNWYLTNYIMEEIYPGLIMFFFLNLIGVNESQDAKL